MNKTEIVAHSISPHGEELISGLLTFPRIILAEVNTHRMLGKNTSSSRAIPFLKMLETIQENPFIPLAWQKGHSGMQGTEYVSDRVAIQRRVDQWLYSRDLAVLSATKLYEPLTEFDEQTAQYAFWEDEEGITKQLCNRLLEPFMWTTMLITGNREHGAWNNFFNLRCPQYENDAGISWKSQKEFTDENGIAVNFDEWDWKYRNKGQAEIHIMDLAEKMFDSVNMSKPKKLNEGEWHIPFEDKIPFVANLTEKIDPTNRFWKDFDDQNKVKISTAMAAWTSYTVVGTDKDMNFEKMIGLHDRLLDYKPPHSSPLEHCNRTMTNQEHMEFFKGKLQYQDMDGMYEIEEPLYSEKGWCTNVKGFIPYRYMIDNNYEM